MRSRRLRRSFLLLSAVFSAGMLLLALLSIIAFYGLSGARAYVHGESQWTKAQKQAVIALFDYAATGQARRYEAFEQALSVNHGDRRARLALSREAPDYQAAREGFLAGRNRPEDIALMMHVFVIGRSLPPFADAIEAWSQADRLIERLEAEARTLRERVEQSGPGSAPVMAQLEEIQRLDQALTRQEDRFSHAMGRISHQLTRYSSIAVMLAAMVLIIAASLLAWRLMRIIERSEGALLESEQRYTALVDQPEVGMWQIDPDGRIVFLNPAMRKLLGLAPHEDVSGQPMDQFLPQWERQRVADNRVARSRGKGEVLEVELVPRQGSTRIGLVHGAPIRIDEAVIGHIGTCVDITARKNAERELRHQVLHDELTGLPNRRLFIDRLDMALRRARRTNGSVAVLFVDLDRFKVVNDGLGHAAGDEILCQAARRLAAQMRDPDSIARFGGDEFGVVVEQVESIADAVGPAKRIIHAFESPFRVRDVNAHIGTSIGIALSQANTTSPEDLIRQADIAMYSAKKNGGGGLHVHDPEDDDFQRTRLQFESDLWKAADNDELRLVYQPINDLESGEVESLEALLRWRHPQRGLLSPDQFIGIAEETGAIASLGRWVVRQACADFAQMKIALGDYAPQGIAVNVSDAEFRLGDPAQHLLESCREMHVPPQAIRIEVTESMLTLQPQALRRIESMGHDIVIDDFGTDYASLDRLRHVPFGTIKIDRSFVAAFEHSTVDLSIIEAIKHIGQRLNVRVVAEGIEHESQVRRLRALGCRYGQGFHFARPRPLAQVLESLARETGKR